MTINRHHFHLDQHEICREYDEVMCSTDIAYHSDEFTIDFTHLLAIMTTTIIAIIINTIVHVNAEIFRVP